MSEPALPDVIGRFQEAQATSPAGEVDLRYQFQLRGGRIADLVIEP